MTHDIPRFGTPDGGLTWASTGTHGGHHAPADHTPRSAAVLLTRALGRLDGVQPLEIREPIAAMLAAGIEQCVVSRSLLGKPVVNLLALAHALVNAPPQEVPDV